MALMLLPLFTGRDVHIKTISSGQTVVSSGEVLLVMWISCLNKLHETQHKFIFGIALTGVGDFVTCQFDF